MNEAAYKTLKAVSKSVSRMNSLRKADIKFRLHLVGFAHLPISEEYLSCAFTQKIIKFSKMMLSLGHEVYIYGSEGSDVPCTEFIQTITLEDIRNAWGDAGNDSGIGYDWKSETGFRVDRDTPERVALYGKHIEACKKEIAKRATTDDILCLTMGEYHKKIAEFLGMPLTVETGIGYMNSFAKFRAFESAFIRNYTYGVEEAEDRSKKTGLGKGMDRVIPNYFDDSQFDSSQEKEDYMLYIGRLVNYKGIKIAVELAKELKIHLKIAGQGEIEIADEYKPYVEYVGFADMEKRKELLAKAKCFIYPTLYREPFGGAIIEAMLSGTPVLTTNYGAFPELVQNGINGYRCDMFQDFVDYGRKIMDGEFTHLNKRYLVRRQGEKYLMDNVKWEFQKWFEDLKVLLDGAKAGDKKAWYRLRSENDVK